METYIVLFIITIAIFFNKKSNFKRNQLLKYVVLIITIVLVFGEIAEAAGRSIN